MIDAPPAYQRPSSVEEAVALLEQFGEDASPIAGGTELVMVLRLGLSGARWLCDVRGIRTLRRLEQHPDGRISIGAAVTHAEVQESADVRRLLPSMSAMSASIGNLRVRNAGTVGGNLCFADPQSDMSTYLLTAGARARCAAPGGAERVLEIGTFLRDAYTTARVPTELLTSIEVSAPVPGQVLCYDKHAPRERPDVACGVRAVWNSAEGIDAVDVVVGAMTPVPMRMEAGAQLVGRQRDDITASDVRELAWSCAHEALAFALYERRTPHMASVAAAVVARTLDAAVHPGGVPGVGTATHSAAGAIGRDRNGERVT